MKGQRKHYLYRTWFDMKQRCENPNKWQFKYYGAKGIKVCERWQVFDNFYFDMGDRPKGCTLDRIDNNKDYCKENCRWADRVTQANNARNNRKLLVNGELIGLCEAGRKYGILYSTICARLKAGWSEQDAATVPKLRNRSTSKYRFSSANERRGV